MPGQTHQWGRLNYLDHVLVPTAVVLLIQGDMNIGFQDAFKIMRESAEYGCAMFPQDKGLDHVFLEALEEQDAA